MAAFVDLSGRTCRVGILTLCQDPQQTAVLRRCLARLGAALAPALLFQPTAVYEQIHPLEIDPVFKLPGLLGFFLCQ